jgi:hypothetical protein
MLVITLTITPQGSPQKLPVGVTKNPAGEIQLPRKPGAPSPALGLNPFSLSLLPVILDDRETPLERRAPMELGGLRLRFVSWTGRIFGDPDWPDWGDP